MMGLLSTVRGKPSTELANRVSGGAQTLLRGSSPRLCHILGRHMLGPNIGEGSSEYMYAFMLCAGHQESVIVEKHGCNSAKMLKHAADARIRVRSIAVS